MQALSVHAEVPRDEFVSFSLLLSVSAFAMLFPAPSALDTGSPGEDRGKVPADGGLGSENHRYAYAKSAGPPLAYGPPTKSAQLGLQPEKYLLAPCCS